MMRFFPLSISLALALGCSTKSTAPTSKNMKLVGTNDLQARSNYQVLVQKQGNRYIAYVGHHTLTGPGEGLAPAGTPPLPRRNPLTGVDEENGTSIVDVTDPAHPNYLAHIPVGDTLGGGAQMTRVCANLPNGGAKVYLLRNYHNSAHEIWDVTDPSNPQGVRTVRGGNPLVGQLVTTHKNWWECDTGIAYIVGSRASDATAGWTAGHHVMIYNLSNPTNPVFIRDWALDGQQPGGTVQPNFQNRPAIHGPISTGPTKPDGTGNRVYLAYGVGETGVMQIADRTRLLANSCGRTCTDYITPEVGRWIMNPENGGHTSWPLGKMTILDFTTGNGNDKGTVRDIVVVTSEATGNFCNEVRHLTFFVDVTDEGRPQGISTFQVPAESGTFCDVGGRFGPHATNEEFGPPFYQKLIFISYFNAGVRAVDVRDPYNPTETAFYIPAVTPNTDLRCGPYQGNRCVDSVNHSDCVCRPVVQTNNVATDDRGYVYIVDRANTGMHILQLTGDAAAIAGLPR